MTWQQDGKRLSRLIEKGAVPYDPKPAALITSMLAALTEEGKPPRLADRIIAAAIDNGMRTRTPPVNFFKQQKFYPTLPWTIARKTRVLEITEQLRKVPIKKGWGAVGQPDQGLNRFAWARPLLNGNLMRAKWLTEPTGDDDGLMIALTELEDGSWEVTKIARRANIPTVEKVGSAPDRATAIEAHWTPASRPYDRHAGQPRPFRAT